ncbi:hypothetical protein IT781_00970 [Methylobacter sp. BlB1]|nr:hypothetical protein [Methylobacter sp. BlB1]
MVAADIHNAALSSLTVLQPSADVLAGWGRTTSSSLHINKTTQISKIECGYVLFVDGRLVIVKLSDNQYTETSQETSNSQPVAIAERLDLIKDRLALSITQLAELFGVTRKTVYDWYEGTEPRRTAINRMEILINVLNEVSPEVDLTRLKAVWNIPVSGKSFRMVFGNDNIDAEALQRALTEKLDELSSRIIASTGPMRKINPQFGEAHLAEFDKRTDLG